MNLSARLKKVENQILYNPDLFPEKIDFDNMPEEDLKRYVDLKNKEIKEKFHLDDEGIEDYFNHVNEWYEMNKVDEEKAGKFWGKYELDLMIKYWERQTGRKWEGEA